MQYYSERTHLMSDAKFVDGTTHPKTVEAAHTKQHAVVAGEPVAHQVGTGVGAAGGAAAGAAVGAAVGGPIGAVVGAAVGGVSGALAGHGVARAFDPKVEDAYWREHHANRPYAKGHSYDDLSPAYRYGGQSAASHQGKTYDTEAVNLEKGWDASRGSSRLAWQDAKGAVQDGWQRVESPQDR
jgi:phage tail tape-measure protein